LPIAVATFEHVVRTVRAHYLSIGIMFTDQQIGGTPSQSLGRRRC
jgi:hypothetical protein